MNYKANKKKNNLAKKHQKSTILTWFSTGYQVENRDWELIQKYGNPYHPLWGYYKSDDQDILNKQINAIRRAQIDVIAYDMFPHFKWTPKDIRKDRAFPMMTSILEDQKEKEGNLKYFIFFENYIDKASFEELDLAMSYLYDNYFERDCYFKENNQPLIMILSDDDIEEELNKLRTKYKDCKIYKVFGGWKNQDGWPYTDTYPQKINPDWIPVSPGYDSSLEEVYLRDMYLKTLKTDIELNKKFLRWVEDPHKSLESIRENPIVKALRDDGAFYRKQLERALKYNPKYVFISSWNDWQYQIQIEPAVEYGFKYVDITSDIIKKFNLEEQ